MTLTRQEWPRSFRRAHLDIVHNLQFISNDAPLAALRRRYLVTNVVAAELEKDYFSSRLRAELKRRESLRLV